MFSTTKMVIGSALLATAVGCASVPTTSRTGVIHEVRFEESMTPATLRVSPDDEIRWINQRSSPVTVEFLGDALNSVSCERGFSTRGFGNLGGRLQESTTIDPNETASLCFSAQGTVTYNARMESPVAGGQMIESGSIIVGF